MFRTIKITKNAKRGLLLCIVLCACIAGVISFNSSNKTVGCRQGDLFCCADNNSVFTNATAKESDTSKSKVAYLTFDDGPSSVTAEILDTLKAESVPATFFVIAAENNIDFLPLLQRTKDEGHYIALHSCTHSYKKIYKSTESFWQDLEELAAKIAPYTNNQVPSCIRFPGGSTNTVSRRYGGGSIMKELKEQAVAKGFKYVDWNVCANDAVGANPSPEKIASTVIRQCKSHPTAVILMHDAKTNSATAKALPTIIKWLRENGYSFNTVDNLDIQI